jgi:hypothetical protein
MAANPKAVVNVTSSLLMVPAPPLASSVGSGALLNTVRANHCGGRVHQSHVHHREQHASA